MPSDPARVTRSGRISKQTSTATSISRSKPRDGPSRRPTSHSNRAKVQTNTTSTESNLARAAALEELIAQRKERIRRTIMETEETTNTHRSRRIHSPQRTLQSSAASSPFSRDHRACFQKVDYKSARTLCSSICCRFPLIERIHIENIYHGHFEARNLPQLADSCAADIAPRTYEIDSFAKLLRCVENYGQIVCHFTPPASEVALQRALSFFRVKLLRYLDVYTFQSVCEWCLCFIAIRIVKGPYDPVGWKDGASELQYKLVPLQCFGGDSAIEEY